MLPERYRQLLTASVDGELTRRQRRQVERLLQHNPEAREMLDKLQRDALALRRLPRRRPAADLTAGILDQIHASRRHPTRSSRWSRPAILPAWTGAAVAAAVLLVVGLGSYFYFALSFPQEPGHARIKPSPQDTHPKTTPPPSPGSADRDQERSPTADPPEQKKSSSGSHEPVKVSPPVPPSNDPPRPGDPLDDVFTGGLDPLVITQVEGAYLPVVFKLEELSQPSVRDQLRAELKKDHAFRLELPCANGTRVLERLQADWKKRKIACLWDPKAQERLREPRIVTSYALYLEDLTAEQLLQLLAPLTTHDRRSTAGRATDGQADSLVLRRLHPSDHKELAALFGMDPTQLPAASKSSSAGSPTVLVAPYPATLAHGGTAQIRHHIETRSPPRSGTLSVLLVLRSR